MRAKVQNLHYFVLDGSLFILEKKFNMSSMPKTLEKPIQRLKRNFPKV